MAASLPQDHHARRPALVADNATRPQQRGTRRSSEDESRVAGEQGHDNKSEAQSTL